jgi:hypothetical protein
VKKPLLSLLGLAAALLGGWILLTSLAPGSSIATWAPCPRNWAWLPAWLPRKSPLDAVEIALEDVHAKLCYGRPSLAGRRMLGGDAVPYGQLWRLGANEPTTLHLDRPARLAGLVLLPGSYSLYAIPEPDAWRFVVNRSTRQWGLESEYTPEIAAREVGRVAARVEPLPAPVETLTVRAVPTVLGALELVFEWETARVRLPLVGGLGEEEEPEVEEEAPINPELL